MIKKILLGTLFVGLIAVLIFGAVNRTVAKSGDNNGLFADLISQWQGNESQNSFGQGEARSERDQNEEYGKGNPNFYSQAAGTQGSGRNRASEQETAQGIRAQTAAGDTVPGWGRQASENGYGQGALRNENAGLNGTGTGVPNPQAEVQEWLTLHGTVSSVSELEVVIQLQEGGQLLLDGRSLSYALEQGLQFQVGDQLMLAAFEENGSYEVGGIQNLTNGQVTVLRSETGRPLWAGQGRRGSGSAGQ